MHDALDRLLALAGDPFARLARGDLVLLKPNLFQDRPGFHVSADVLAALAARIAAKGARVVIGERTQVLHRVLHGHDVHRYADVRSFDDCPLRVVAIAGATSLRVPIAVPDVVVDCDYFVGVPQLRTHASVVFSNAMKNLVGLLPGYTTRIVHMAGVDESTVDLNLLRPQNLVVTDGTTVIEGNYPIAGQARHVGLLSVATNAVAADVVMATVAGLDPASVAYLTDAARRGLGPASIDEVDVVGEPIADVAFTIDPAPAAVRAPRAGIHVHVDSACEACRRYVAAALEALADEFLAWPGEMTIVAGPREHLPPLRGAVVLVGNGLYEHRERGVYVEGCPPRAIQVAAFRYAMGGEVTAAERTQFRVPAAGMTAGAPT